MMHVHSGKTRLAGVMGSPVTHSLSPRLHGYWLHEYDIDGAYVPLAVEPDGFAMALRGLSAMGFAGANVTVPHKEAALGAVDHVSETAAAIGAVNTLICHKDGTVSGDNTDAHGFIENVRMGAPNWSAKSAPALVLGAGGAARAVVYALLQAGVPEIFICNRTEIRAKELATEFGPSMTVVPWDARNEATADIGLLVNTTTLGMTGQADLDISINALPPSAVVTDIVYNPLVTPLLAAAAARDLTTVDGLGMLLHQAAPGFERWFGVTPTVTPELRTFVLAGMIA